jgi:hypothetical protein
MSTVTGQKTPAQLAEELVAQAHAARGETQRMLAELAALDAPSGDAATLDRTAAMIGAWL